MSLNKSTIEFIESINNLLELQTKYSMKTMDVSMNEIIEYIFNNSKQFNFIDEEIGTDGVFLMKKSDNEYIVTCKDKDFQVYKKEHSNLKKAIENKVQIILNGCLVTIRS